MSYTASSVPSQERIKHLEIQQVVGTVIFSILFQSQYDQIKLMCPIILEGKVLELFPMYMCYFLPISPVQCWEMSISAVVCQSTTTWWGGGESQVILKDVILLLKPLFPRDCINTPNNWCSFVPWPLVGPKYQVNTTNDVALFPGLWLAPKYHIHNKY